MKLNVKKIDFELNRLGWNRTRLAKEMGYSPQRLSYILRREFVKLKAIDRIAESIQVNARDLLE